MDYFSKVLKWVTTPTSHDASANSIGLEVQDAAQESAESWSDFIAATYGCLADAPIERGEQGDFEIRDLLR